MKSNQSIIVVYRLDQVDIRLEEEKGSDPIQLRLGSVV